MKKSILSFVFSFGLLISNGQSIEITPSSTTATQSNTDDIVLRTTGNPNIVGVKFNGSLASPLPTTNTTTLLAFNGRGYNGSAFTGNRASIEFKAAEDWTSNDNGTKIHFSTTSISSTGTNIRMTIDHNGFVGLGTSSPTSLLHISNAVSGVTPSSNTKAFIEDINHTYISFGTPDNKESGILFGRPSFGGASGGIIYNINRDLLFRTSTNDTRMVITEAGNVGIGTNTPEAKLDVVGDVKLSRIKLDINTSISLDPLDRQNNSYHVINFTAAGSGSTVFLRGITAPASGNGTMLYLLVAGTGFVRLQHSAGTNPANRLLNNDGADITITDNGSAIYIYDSSGWRLLSFTQ
ncbi:hypothetical protein GCM10011514_03170 [Emticicia aquatilis]|uniref:Uncharacterized protein n=1 Tax=Emticicia aquatilis TaxID=1537369 RepID=A0A916YFJ1_9BACT|nr:hypothetical protein [Emticicia aquatilis]GGD42564.1 hypothetical protein GCM10011514_03170 [Emticicia aquatilis]